MMKPLTVLLKMLSNYYFSCLHSEQHADQERLQSCRLVYSGPMLNREAGLYLIALAKPARCRVGCLLGAGKSAFTLLARISPVTVAG